MNYKFNEITQETLDTNKNLIIVVPAGTSITLSIEVDEVDSNGEETGELVVKHKEVTLSKKINFTIQNHSFSFDLDHYMWSDVGLKGTGPVLMVCGDDCYEEYDPEGHFEYLMSSFEGEKGISDDQSANTIYIQFSQKTNEKKKKKEGQLSSKLIKEKIIEFVKANEDRLSKQFVPVESMLPAMEVKNWKRTSKAKEFRSSNIQREFDCDPYDDQLGATVITNPEDTEILELIVEGK